MLEVYRRFCEDFLAIPLIGGRKSAAERFPGADETYTIEGLMGDGRALQCGTSHFLGPELRQGLRDPLPRREQPAAISPGRPVGEFRRGCWAPSSWCMATIRACGFRPQWRPRRPSSCRSGASPKSANRFWRRARDSRRLDAAGIRAHIDEREGVTPGFKFNDLGDARGAGARRDRAARRRFRRGGPGAPRSTRRPKAKQQGADRRVCSRGRQHC